jgi:predicted alpha/beta-hydrolase family hydrolase
MSRGVKRPVTLELGGRETTVSALYHRPADARALYVLAHGAGAGMEHAFMSETAARLYDSGIATLRYNFPYMETGRRGRPDSPALLTATVRAAVARAAKLSKGLPLVAGGKSMGGRMTSQAQSVEPLAGVKGLVFLGFPLHAPGRDGTARAAHLSEIEIPMLFIQGTRDSLANLDLMREVCEGLGRRATLAVIDGGDHSFKVLKRSGRTPDEVMEEIASVAVRFIERAIR